jgi:glycerol-1-phosphate dehydrogenase [NAD(P)+]
MTLAPIVDPTDLEAVSAAVARPSAPNERTSQRLHPVGLRHIAIGPDALDELGSLVAGLARPGPIGVVMDHVPMRRGSANLKPLILDRLAAYGDARPVWVGPPSGPVHADAETIDAARDAVEGAGLIVAVGSGTVCDIGKELARPGDVPIVVIQTACSVNAFADDMAVLLINGVKRTVPSRWPDALIVDLTVIADAPRRMNQAGIGELASMFTAPADWRLAAAAGMDESYDERVVRLFRDAAPMLGDAAQALAGVDPAAYRPMCALMTLTGLALGIAGRTAPMSGIEHTVSHLLDMAAARRDDVADLHGAQVGVASLAVTVAWQGLLADFDPNLLLEGRGTDPERMRRRIGDAFGRLDPSGAMAAECWRAYEEKLARWTASPEAIRTLIDDWPQTRLDLDALLGQPADIAAALRQAGAPATFEELDPAVDRDTATWALLNGHLMRDRFTMADLAWFAGLWDEDRVRGAIDSASALAGR